MGNNFIDKLSLLELEKKYLKRELDNNWYDRNKRQKIFDKIKDVNKKIDYIKFKIRLERKMKDENNNTY